MYTILSLFIIFCYRLCFSKACFESELCCFCRGAIKPKENASWQMDLCLEWYINSITTGTDIMSLVSNSPFGEWCLSIGIKTLYELKIEWEKSNFPKLWKGCRGKNKSCAVSLNINGFLKQKSNTHCVYSTRAFCSASIYTIIFIR